MTSLPFSAPHVCKVIICTNTQTRAKMDTYEDEKKYSTLSKRKRRVLLFFGKLTDSALFTAVRQKMADRSLWRRSRMTPLPALNTEEDTQK